MTPEDLAGCGVFSVADRDAAGQIEAARERTPGFGQGRTGTENRGRCKAERKADHEEISASDA